MATFDTSNWPRHQLRLAFFDFTIRGEGDADVIAAVLRTWRADGALCEDDCRQWFDALAWRGLGNRLPGWTDPAHQPGSKAAEAPATEEDYEAFVSWRSERRQAVAA